MNITLDNYEAYFLDYNEGRLNSDELGELSLFLTLHPELKSDLIISEDFVLQSNKYTYQNKSLIKKFDFLVSPVNKSNFEDFCIAYNEGLFSNEKVKEFEIYCLADPSKEQILNLYKKAFLKPPINEVYPYKKTLYKATHTPLVSRVIMIRCVSIAAGLALLVGTFSVLRNTENNVSSKVIAHSNRSYYKENIEVNNNIKLNKALIKNKLNIKKTEIETITGTPNKTNVNSAPNEILAQRIEPKLKLLNPSIHNSLKESRIESTSVSSIESHNENMTALISPSENINNKVTKGKFLFLKLAKLGIQGYNKLTDSNLTFTEKTDSLGNITALSIQSDLLEYHRTKSN